MNSRETGWRNQGDLFYSLAKPGASPHNMVFALSRVGTVILFLTLKIFLFYVYKCFACMNVSVLCMCSACGGQKTVSDPWKPELQGYKPPGVRARNWTQVVWKSSKCSQPRSHLSPPEIEPQSLVWQEGTLTSAPPRSELWGAFVLKLDCHIFFLTVFFLSSTLSIFLYLV